MQAAERTVISRPRPREGANEKAKVAEGIARYESANLKKARWQTYRRMKQQDTQKKRRDESENKR
jgi:hypothetical protein